MMAIASLKGSWLAGNRFRALPPSAAPASRFFRPAREDFGQYGFGELFGKAHQIQRQKAAFVPHG
jgi:hypothetical protein